MIEAGAIAAALIGLFSAVSTRLHNRIHDMDKRVDAFELRIAENYLTKALERVEQHMVRIENKLDRLANCDKKYDHPY
jgi:archaellum component FlaC